MIETTLDTLLVKMALSAGADACHAMALQCDRAARNASDEVMLKSAEHWRANAKTLEALLSGSPGSAPARKTTNTEGLCTACGTEYCAEHLPLIQWLDISTAPKDGTRMLLHPGHKHYSVVGRWSLTHGWWEALPGKLRIQPTHWTALPLHPDPAERKTTAGEEEKES